MQPKQTDMNSRYNTRTIFVSIWTPIAFSVVPKHTFAKTPTPRHHGPASPRRASQRHLPSTASLVERLRGRNEARRHDRYRIAARALPWPSSGLGAVSRQRSQVEAVPNSLFLLRPSTFPPFVHRISCS